MKRRIPIPVAGKRSKYRAVRTEVDGISFHSKKEARFYADLKILKNDGIYASVELQVQYPLVVNGKLICTYVADFVTRKAKSESPEVWDCKGFVTREYRLKKKLFEALMGMRIQEV